MSSWGSLGPVILVEQLTEEQLVENAQKWWFLQENLSLYIQRHMHCSHFFSCMSLFCKTTAACLGLLGIIIPFFSLARIEGKWLFFNGTT